MSGDGIFLMTSGEATRACFILEKSLERALVSKPLVSDEVFFSDEFGGSFFSEITYSNTSFIAKIFPELEAHEVSIFDLDRSAISRNNLVRSFRETIQEATEVPLEPNSRIDEFTEFLVEIYEKLPGSGKGLPCPCLVPSFTLLLGFYLSFKQYQLFATVSTRNAHSFSFRGYLDALNVIAVEKALYEFSEDDEVLDGYMEILEGLRKDRQALLGDRFMTRAKKQERLTSWFFPKATQELVIPLFEDLLGCCHECATGLELNFDESGFLPSFLATEGEENRKAYELFNFIKELNQAIKRERS